MEKRMKYIALIFFLNETWAANFYSSYSQMFTNDGYKISSTSFEYNSSKINIFWPYKSETEFEKNYGVKLLLHNGTFNKQKLEGTDFKLNYGKKFNFSEYINISTGFSRLKYNNSKTTPTFHIDYDKKLEEFNFSSSFYNDFYYKTKGIKSPLQNALKETTLKLRGKYFINENLNTSQKISISQISDENTSNQQEFLISAGTIYPTWFWLSYGLERLSFKNETAGYWSPSLSFSHGPRLEIGRNFFELIELGASYSFSFTKERNFARGKSTYFSTTLKIGSRETKHFILNYYKTKSIQQQSDWTEQGLLASYFHEFGY